jgi:hypothetical protein
LPQREIYLPLELPVKKGGIAQAFQKQDCNMNTKTPSQEVGYFSQYNIRNEKYTFS